MLQAKADSTPSTIRVFYSDLISASKHHVRLHARYFILWTGTNMVSPEASSLAAQVTGMRNPRRRQRDSEEGATLRQQPQRKRSKLSNENSDRPVNDVNGNARTYPNGHVKGSLRVRSPSPRVQHIPVREKKLHSHRVTKGDGSTILVSEYIEEL